jgi:hypothetical protein
MSLEILNNAFKLQIRKAWSGRVKHSYGSLCAITNIYQDNWLHFITLFTHDLWGNETFKQIWESEGLSFWRDKPGILLEGLRDMANCFISPLLGFESGYKTFSIAVTLTFSAVSCQCCQLCYSMPNAFLANTTNCNVHLMSSIAIMVDYFFSHCWLFLVCWKHSQVNYPSKERLEIIVGQRWTVYMRCRRLVQVRNFLNDAKWASGRHYLVLAQTCLCFSANTRVDGITYRS